MASISAARKQVSSGERAYLRRRRLKRIALLAIVAFALFYALFPVWWVFSASINPSNSLIGQGLIPNNASLVNYERLLDNPQHPFLRWLVNSTYISLITSTLSVFVSALSAYAFSRFRFKGRRTMLLTVFLVQIFPNSLTMVATFLLIQAIGSYIPVLGLNSHGGLILVYLGGAMGINTWMMKGFFDTVPREIDESARIDGASDWQIFWRVIFPLVRPVLAVVGIITFVFTYSDYVMPLVLIRDTNLFTLTRGLTLFLGDSFSQRWGVFTAGAVIGLIPTVVFWWLFQDWFVGGLTQGAVKG